MTENTGPAPTGAEDAPAENIRSIAESLPLGAFGIDDEDDAPSGGAAQPAQREADALSRQAAERPAAEQPRAADGRWAARDGAAQPGDAPVQDPAAEEAPQEEAAPGAEEQPEAETGKPEGKRLDFVELDGRRYSTEDIQRGFLRQEDYSRKTGEVARERQQIQQQAEQVRGYEQQLAGILELAVTALRDSLPGQPDPALIDTDLVGYHKQMASHNAAVQKLQQIAQHREQMGRQTQEQSQQEQRQSAERLQQHQHQQFTLLQEKIPELRDEQARGTFFRKAGEYAGRYGLGLDEIGNATLNDHRIALVLKDAMFGAEVRAQRPQTAERLKAAPPIRPAARPAAGTREGQARRDANEQFARNPTLKTALNTGVLDDVFADL